MNNHPSAKAFILSICSVLLLLQGCTSKEVAPPFTADPAAFEYGVAATAEMQLYTRECSKLGGNLQNISAETKKAWYERNWPLSHVADVGYSQKLAAQSIEYNNEKIALAAIKLYANIEKPILLKLNQTRHSPSRVAETCTKKLAAYKDGTLDISKNKNAGLYLKSLVTTTPATYKIPSLAGSLQPSSAPGRSQYSLDKNLAEWDCANGDVLTLRNQWPYEGYGAFCPSGKTIFISCEWGECKTH